MSYLDQLATNDEEEIVRKLSRIVTDMYVEDWNDTSIVQFQEELHQIRVEIENIQDASAATDSKSRFISVSYTHLDAWHAKVYAVSMHFL